MVWASPSILSTPFHAHSVRSISLISNRLSSKNTFLLYFGANTMWYLQFHLLCAILCTLSFVSDIRLSSDFVYFIATARSQFHYTKSEFFFQFFIGKPFLNHATIAWFYLYKKRSEGKHFYVYMMAGANKFLRIYYTRVMEHLNSLWEAAWPYS